MSTVVAALPTVGTIASRTKRSHHQIEYLIKSRGIKPIGRAGNAYVYSEASVGQIQAELDRIDAERSTGSGD